MVFAIYDEIINVKCLFFSANLQLFCVSPSMEKDRAVRDILGDSDEDEAAEYESQHEVEQDSHVSTSWAAWSFYFCPHTGTSEVYYWYLILFP